MNKEDKEMSSIEFDNSVKLMKYYNGRIMRHFVTLMEMAESICRSSVIPEKSKIVARGYANHYRRMVMCVAAKPFNPDETDEWSSLEKKFAFEVSILEKLMDENLEIN